MTKFHATYIISSLEVPNADKSLKMFTFKFKHLSKIIKKKNWPIFPPLNLYKSFVWSGNEAPWTQPFSRSLSLFDFFALLLLCLVFICVNYALLFSLLKQKTEMGSLVETSKEISGFM